jgi:bifunctional DNA-binding transcriptional regulator/antitoxin component of YhaV-PrlF toxin-antitoxin module
MSEVVSVDEKGRLVLPKKVRQEAHISVRTKLVARASGVGRVELSDPKVLTVQAQDIGAKKLAGWKEDDHEATSHLLGSMKRKNETR